MSAGRWPTPALRCAARADQRGDPMLGTAFPAARLLLVEQPYAWGSEGLRTSRFARGVALALEARGRAETVRVQAIRRLGPAHRSGPRRWALVDTRPGRREIRWGHFEADDDLLELPFDSSVGVPSRDPVYLVCTHGRHDPCCAQRGRPVAAALAELRPDAVWQASHLGGCRFAPTVLALPGGLMYGRMMPEAVPELVAATEAGRVESAFLRGRIGMSGPAQCALTALGGELGLNGLDDVRFVSSETVAPGRVRVRARAEGRLYDVEVDQTRVDAEALTCAHPGATWFAAYTAGAVSPVAG